MKCQKDVLLVTLAAVAAVCLASVSSAAHAQQQKSCTANTDCDKGFTCQVVGGTACPGVACASGQPCDASVPDCTPTDIKACVPGPCTADSDCATDMVCYATTQQDCPVSTQPACDPNSSTPCPKIDPVPCTPKTVKTCTPRYLVPCTVDADCGDHFTCVQDKQCSCSGGSATIGSGSSSGGTSARDAGATPVPEPAPLDASTAVVDAGCECKNLDTKSCAPVKIPCTKATASTACPAQWTCVSDLTSTGSGTGCAVPAGADAAACPAPEPMPAPTPSVGACAPPYFATPGVTKGGGAELGNAGGTPTQAGADAAGHTGHSAADAGAGDGGTPKAKDSGGICSVSSLGQHSAGHSTLAWLALAGLALHLRRRRVSAR